MLVIPCPTCGKPISGVNEESARFNLSAHQQGSKCRKIAENSDSQIEHRNQELEAVKAELTNIEPKRIELAEITEQFNKTKFALETVERKLSALNADVKRTEAELEEITAQNAEAVEEAESLDSRVSALTADISRLQPLGVAVERLCAQKAELTKEVDELNAQVLVLKTEMSRLVALRGDLEKSANLAAVKAEVEDLRKLDDELTEVLLLKKKQLERLELFLEMRYGLARVLDNSPGIPK